MNWIVAVREKDGKVNELKMLIWSLDRPDIEYTITKKSVIANIKSGFKTAFLEKGVYKPGADVVVFDEDDLRTKQNGVIYDNLGKLPKF